jgi:hypothetical protein
MTGVRIRRTGPHKQQMGGTVKCGRRDTADNAGDPHQRLSDGGKTENGWTPSPDATRKQIALGVATASHHATHARAEVADD